MCGRFSLNVTLDKLIEFFEIDNYKDLCFEPTKEIFPSNYILALTIEDGRKVLKSYKWGFVPHWSPEDKKLFKPINAKFETLFSKPFFRDSAKSKRCLIITDGFYEWRKEEERKVPYVFRLRGSNIFSLAGIWDLWKSKNNNNELLTVSIVTTEANKFMHEYHDRMPVIISPESSTQKMWLDLKTPENDLKAAMKACDNNVLYATKYL